MVLMYLIVCYYHYIISVIILIYIIDTYIYFKYKITICERSFLQKLFCFIIIENRLLIDHRSHDANIST